MKIKKKCFITALATLISMLLSIISPGVIVFSENSKSLQNDDAIEITSTLRSNTISNGEVNTLRIDYNILKKNKLQAGDKIVVKLPEIFNVITPKYPKEHFLDCTNENGVVTLTFNENVKDALRGYILISLIGNDKIENDVSYPIQIDLDGKTEKNIKTEKIDVEGYKPQSSSGMYPIMYKVADLPIANVDKSGKRESYGEILNKENFIKYFVEINAGDGKEPSTRSYLRSAKFLDNIPKGMDLDTNNISIIKHKFDKKSLPVDVTQEFRDNNRIKANSRSLEIDFSDIAYEHYTIIYETKITSIEDEYRNNAVLYYDGNKGKSASYYAKLSQDAGALNIHKTVDKTNVTNDPKDQKITYEIKFDSHGYFLKNTLNISDKLDSRLSDIKIIPTNQFTAEFDEKTKEIKITNDKADIEPDKPAYITIEASMKNVEPGGVVENTAYVDGKYPTETVSTKKSFSRNNKDL